MIVGNTLVYYIIDDDITDNKFLAMCLYNAKLFHKDVVSFGFLAHAFKNQLYKPIIEKLEEHKMIELFGASIYLCKDDKIKIYVRKEFSEYKNEEEFNEMIVIATKQLLHIINEILAK